MVAAWLVINNYPTASGVILGVLVVISLLVAHRLWLCTCRVCVSNKLLEVYYNHHHLIESSNAESHNLSFYSNYTKEVYDIFQDLQQKYPYADDAEVFNACYSVVMGRAADYVVHTRIRVERAIDIYQALLDYLREKTFCSYWYYRKVMSGKFFISIGG